jgi:hypothetical protein
MAGKAAPRRTDPRDAEIAALRAQVSQLETELADQAASANSQLAAAQRRAYWLDRLDLDLNVTLGRPAIAAAVLVPLRLVRWTRRESARLRRAIAR